MAPEFWILLQALKGKWNESWPNRWNCTKRQFAAASTRLMKDDHILTMSLQKMTAA